MESPAPDCCSSPTRAGRRWRRGRPGAAWRWRSSSGRWASRPSPARRWPARRRSTPGWRCGTHAGSAGRTRTGRPTGARPPCPSSAPRSSCTTGSHPATRKQALTRLDQAAVTEHKGGEEKSPVKNSLKLGWTHENWVQTSANVRKTGSNRVQRGIHKKNLINYEKK